MFQEQWRRNLVGVLIAAFVSILGFNLVFPFLPLFIRTLGDYDADEAAFWTGVIGLITGVVGSAAALVWGQMADRKGRWPMIIRATAGAAAGLAVMGLAGGLTQLLLGRVMFSALAGTVPAANPLIAANTPPEHLSMAMGALQSSVFLSNTLGPLIGGGLAGAVGYRASFLITAALYIASAAPVMLLVRERFTPPVVQRGLVRGIRADFGYVMRRPAFVYPIAASLLALCAANVATTVFSLLIEEMAAGKRAETLAGLAFFVMGLASAVTAFSIGRLVRRFGHRRLLEVTAPASVLIYLALWVTQSYPLFVVWLGLLGLVQGAQVPALTALIAARAPRDRAGAVFGVVSCINSIAFSGGPFFAGMLARLFGLRAVFPVSAIMVAFMILMIERATAPAEGGEPTHITALHERR
ncbi:MAG: MFS transporter [Chloroflexi bacterium]|nr:MFS transporter [Chloroflexota bacterium]